MRNLNGDKVTCDLVVGFDFTREECDRFLSTPTEHRRNVLNQIMQSKNPNPDLLSSYNSDALREAIGKAMVNWREQELRQLPERSES